MSKLTTVWAMVLAVSAAGLACGSNVTVEPTGAGAFSSQGGAGAASSDGGNGGVPVDPSGGSGGEGGVPVGGGPAGGSSSGGGPVGGGGTGGEGGSPICPGFGDTCTECLSTGCSDTFCACSDEIHCFGYLQCLGTCMMGDQPCFQNCAAVHEPGISIAILTADCAATTCDGSCMFGQPLTGCQKCLYTDCSEQMNACLADPECVALVQCLQACPPGDQACGQTCVNDHLMGLPEAQAVRDCRMDFCDGACQ